MYSSKCSGRRDAKGDVRGGCGAPVRLRSSPDRRDQHVDEGRPKEQRSTPSLSVPAEQSCGADSAPGLSAAAFTQRTLEGSSDGGDPQLRPEERTRFPAVSGPAEERSPWRLPGTSGYSLLRPRGCRRLSIDGTAEGAHTRSDEHIYRNPVRPEARRGRLAAPGDGGGARLTERPPLEETASSGECGGLDCLISESRTYEASPAWEMGDTGWSVDGVVPWCPRVKGKTGKPEIGEDWAGLNLWCGASWGCN
ncbi:hypothetical protein NDU88_005927 [Pleurodeles waltl]|uniref:Uncharacterized protein n=1 Tax=Pleurodeles waltl TaxID=8319 RepID=A0AAV7WW32_PLEWA|nr:hypothetical protein NDU88_005927 [Pleurodeles waltl]